MREISHGTGFGHCHWRGLHGSWADTGAPPGPQSPLKTGVSLGTTPGTFIHDPSAEEVLQPLIQAGGCPILLTHPRYWHLLGGKSCKVSHGVREPPLLSSQGFPPLDLDWPFLAPWKFRHQSTQAFPKLGS